MEPLAHLLEVNHGTICCSTLCRVAVCRCVLHAHILGVANGERVQPNNPLIVSIALVDEAKEGLCGNLMVAYGGGRRQDTTINQICHREVVEGKETVRLTLVVCNDGCCDGFNVQMVAANQCTAQKRHWDITAIGSCDFKLSNVWKPVIVASITQEDMVHNELRRGPHPLSDVDWQICVPLVYVWDHLVEDF
jgi:hypothetical protein